MQHNVASIFCELATAVHYGMHAPAATGGVMTARCIMPAFAPEGKH